MRCEMRSTSLEPHGEIGSMRNLEGKTAFVTGGAIYGES
jgi:hypothetical protein